MGSVGAGTSASERTQRFRMDILARAVHHLYRTSVISGGRLYTYENVLSSSDRISNALGKLIDKPFPHEPPRVGLYAVSFLEHSQQLGSLCPSPPHAHRPHEPQAPGAEYLAGTLAIWRAGGIVVPLATSHPPRELSYVLEDAGICAVSGAGRSNLTFAISPL